MNNQNAFPYILDHKPRLLLNWILFRLFKHVRFDSSMTQKLKGMNREGTVVYAIKYRGRLDYLLYHYRFRTSRLPYPKIGFHLNMALVLPLSYLFKVFRFYAAVFFKTGAFPSPFKTGFFEKAIQEKTSALVCLVDPVGFRRHFIQAEKDSLEFLLETQQKTDHPVFVVPQLILYNKTPEKSSPNLFDILFGFRDRIGFPRKIMLFFKNHRRAFIDFGEPVNLKNFIAGQPADVSMEGMTAELRQRLLSSIDQQKRVILGPVMKSRDQFRERVLKDTRVINTIRENSLERKIPLKQSRKKAAGYFNEIAANYTAAYIEVGYIILNWVFNKMFQGIDHDAGELARVREWARKGPLIYMPSHKSHIDYMVLNYVLYEHHMHIPRIAAGKNLSFWPLGYFFRKCGAFFIRRTFKGAKLYSTVFSRYIKALLEEAFPLEFFIEGGRSRSGKLILPKIGFLSILVEAFRQQYCEDLILVPTSISYDRILEAGAYVKEQGGKKKEAENIQQVVRVGRFLKKKYGKIYIRFGEPVSLKEYLLNHSDPRDKRHRKLAFHIIRSINSVTLVTPMALMATAILANHRERFERQEMLFTANQVITFLRRNAVPMADSLKQFEKAMEITLQTLIKQHLVSTMDDKETSNIVYFAKDEKKAELEYYKNSIIHWFLPHVFVALSLLKTPGHSIPLSRVLQDYLFLKKAFRHEFIFSDGDHKEEVIHVLDDFSRDALVVQNRSDNSCQPTMTETRHLYLWANLGRTFLEAYWVAARYTLKTFRQGKIPADPLKNMMELGRKYYKSGRIKHLEAVTQINFKNAMKTIHEDFQILSGKKEALSQKAFDDLVHFTDQLNDFLK